VLRDSTVSMIATHAQWQDILAMVRHRLIVPKIVRVGFDRLRDERAV